VDKAVADAEKAKADVKARENHREVSRRYSEQMTDWVRDKRKEVEVLRGWMAVDNVGPLVMPRLLNRLTRKHFQRERGVKLNELKGARARVPS
jgi:hypothetical protein